MIESLRRMLAPLERRVMGMVGRFVVRAVRDSPKFQEIQAEVLQGELRSKLERFQEYGFTSVPHPGAEGVVVFPSGGRDHGLVICVGDRRYRLTNLEAGEVAIYTDEGDRVHLKRGGTIHVQASTRVEIDAPLLLVNGEIQATGDITDRTDSDGSSMDSMRAIYDAHVHPPSSNGSSPKMG